MGELHQVLEKGLIEPALPQLIHPNPTGSQVRLRGGAHQVRLELPSAAEGLQPVRYEGILRIVYEDDLRLRGSGDLYDVPPSHPHLPWGEEGAAEARLPVFPRSRYHSYLRLLELECGTDLRLTWQIFRFCGEATGWRGEGTFETAFFSAGTNGQLFQKRLEGQLIKQKAPIGKVQARWLDDMVRECSIEVDRQVPTPTPVDSPDLEDLFALVHWRIHLRLDDPFEPEGEALQGLINDFHVWRGSLLQTQMRASRETVNLDEEWRYYILCIKEFHEEPFGRFFDFRGTDAPDFLWGAVVSADGSSPKEVYGSFAHQSHSSNPLIFFRTAVHETLHSMGIDRHLTQGTDLMAPMPILAGALHPNFPAAVRLTFAPSTKLLLRHMPDPLTRPGGIKGGERWDFPDDLESMAGELELQIESTHDWLPFGAPLRLTLQLENIGQQDQLVPEELSFRSGHVYGRVWQPDGSFRVFRTLVRDMSAGALQSLGPGGIQKGGLTVFRGPDGALMPTPGPYEVEVALQWSDGRAPRLLFGSTDFEVNEPVDEKHRELAETLLKRKNVLLALALRVEDPPDGFQAIEDTAGTVLADHWDVVPIKSLLERGRYLDAAGKLGEATILTDRERARIAEEFSQAPKEESLEEVLPKVYRVLSSNLEAAGPFESLSNEDQKSLRRLKTRALGAAEL